MSKIPVVVNGALGKMGREAVKAVTEADDLDLIASIDMDDDLAETLSSNKGCVVVDFTHPSCAYKNCETILDAGAHGVIGTTGLTEDQFQVLDKMCADKKRGFVIAANFAITAVLMMRFAAEAAKHMDRAEIIELHHPAKADSPSGTAVKTAEMMALSREAAGLPDFEGPESEKELIDGARGGSHRGIRLHSVRMPGQLANQEVLLGAPGQTLSIRQDTIDRSCFMPGVVLACRRVRELDGLVVGLDRLLFG